MIPKWLVTVDHEGVHVSRAFMDRLIARDVGALRQLARLDLTTLYRRGYTQLTLRQQSPGLFWTEDAPETVVIPRVQAGRHRIPAWLADEPVMSARLTRKGPFARYLPLLKSARNDLRAQGRELGVAITEDGKKLTAMSSKPNPRFSLVVVNRYDRAALLKLLSEAGGGASIEQWLAERTSSTGATLSSDLFENYEAWSRANGETPCGIKTFAQGLIAAGVEKLVRAKAGERYTLTLL